MPRIDLILQNGTILYVPKIEMNTQALNSDKEFITLVNVGVKTASDIGWTSVNLEVRKKDISVIIETRGE